eukprot:TRINITY_DN779794_c0_g1_i1.p1 TRINITY_DN779794_c0_g1~~TRINITY_DN779794_c0_g1_i1.p1  ORF type:complete len:457 (+),score=122.36 TRINITY_DN779794_c0_g1_i1:60-1373(+)
MSDLELFKRFEKRLEKRESQICAVAPLGLFCFSITTLLLSLKNAEIIESGSMPLIISVAFFYGGLCQVLVGYWEYKKNAAFGMIAFTAYGCFWMSLAMMDWILIYLPQDPVQLFPDGKAVWLSMWGIFTAGMFVFTFEKKMRHNQALQFTFGTLVIAFFLLALGANDHDWHKAGGYGGILCGCIAFYTASAELLNIHYGKTLLPLGWVKKFEAPAEEKDEAIEFPYVSNTANPGPLGLCAFALTTCVLNFKNGEIVESDTVAVIITLGLFFGGMAQILVGMYEARRNNTFGFVCFTTYGAFWMGLGLMDFLLVYYPIADQKFPDGKCAWLILFGLFSLVAFVGTLKAGTKNIALQVTFGTLVLLFALLAAGVYDADIEIIAGYEGILCGLCAMYTGFAEFSHAHFGFNLIPTGFECNCEKKKEELQTPPVTEAEDQV